MSSKRPTTVKLHNAIREEYKRLISIKENGVCKYTSKWVINHIAEKYFRAPATVETIIYGKVKV